MAGAVAVEAVPPSTEAGAAAATRVVALKMVTREAAVGEAPGVAEVAVAEAATLPGSTYLLPSSALSIPH